MEFFKCSIAGVSYGTGVTEIERVGAARKSQVCPHAGPHAEHTVFSRTHMRLYVACLWQGAWSHERPAAR